MNVQLIDWMQNGEGVFGLQENRNPLESVHGKQLKHWRQESHQRLHCLSCCHWAEQPSWVRSIPFPHLFFYFNFLLKFVHSFSQSNKSKEKKNTTCFSPRNPHCHPFPSFLLKIHTLYINLLQLILIIFSRSWFNNNTNRAC